MQSGARVKVLKTLERMKRVAPLYSAWKSSDFRNVFKSRSDILQLSGRLCQRRTKNQPIGGAKVGQSGAAFSDGGDVVSALARALTT